MCVCICICVPSNSQRNWPLIVWTIAQRIAEDKGTGEKSEEVHKNGWSSYIVSLAGFYRGDFVETNYNSVKSGFCVLLLLKFKKIHMLFRIPSTNRIIRLWEYSIAHATVKMQISELLFVFSILFIFLIWFPRLWRIFNTF